MTRKSSMKLFILCDQRQVSFHLHHLLGCHHPKKFKIESQQRAKLREKYCAHFHNSCPCHFDFSVTLRAQFHIWRPGLYFSPG